MKRSILLIAFFVQIFKRIDLNLSLDLKAMDNYTRLFDTIYYQNEKFPQKVSISSKQDGVWKSYSSQELIDEVNKVSRGLIEYGIKPGDKVSIISTNNRTEWNIIDLACLQIGAIDVPVYPTISPSDYQYIFNDAEVKIAFVSDEELLLKLEAIEKNVPSLQEIFSFDTISRVKQWTHFKELAGDNHKEELQQRMDSIQPDDLATLIYTSGTTGQPKGVMLSHKNIVENTRYTLQDLPLRQGHVCLSFLPLCHVFERMVTYSYMAAGAQIIYAESLEKIGENLREIKPHFFTTVPRLLEKVYDRIMSTGLELKGIKRSLFFWALNLGLKYDWRKNQGPIYNAQLSIANRLIFSKWREALGGNIIGIVSGSAPLQERLARVFSAGGIDVREGYGLTETSPVLTYNRFDNENSMLGTVGIPLDNVEIKLAEDGEILAKGPNIMMGYYNKPDQTKEVMTVDGWFKTGDIGELIDGKFLKITDRKKQLMKTSGGKYVAPQPIEEKFKESMLIEQIMVVAEGEKFVSALIVPSFDSLRDWCTSKQIETPESNEELIKTERVLNKYQDILNEYNPIFSQVEQIKKFVLLPQEFTIEKEELTPTMKLKRKNILHNYQNEIKSIYNE